MIGLPITAGNLFGKTEIRGNGHTGVGFNTSREVSAGKVAVNIFHTDSYPGQLVQIIGMDDGSDQDVDTAGKFMGRDLRLLVRIPQTGIA